MAESRVSALRSVEFGVPDLDRSVAFFRDVWGLQEIARHGGASQLRATGAEHDVVTLHEQPETALRRVTFAADDRRAVDALHAKAKGVGANIVSDPAPLPAPGGGYGFEFRDLEDRLFRISAEVEGHSDVEDARDRPRKLSHVVLNSTQVDRATDYFVDLLGFRLSDRTEMMDFIRCNADHHSLAFARLGNASLNHVAFEVPSRDALMRGAGRLKEAGFKVEWGVGRHGPGDNVFAYFIEPNGFVVEYTAEVEQIDEATHRVRYAEDWKRPANRMDQWGFADPPSERVRKAMAGDLQPVT